MAKLGKEEVEEIFREDFLCREWGYRFLRTENKLKAIDYFQKAAKLYNEKDLRVFLGLCEAHTKLSRFDDAVKSSEKCVALDPNNTQAQYMRIEALFNIGEFSVSLCHAHQGLRRRKVPFEWGVHQGNETIENCVGRNTSPKALELLLPWIRELLKHRAILIEKLKEEEDEFEGIDEDQSRFKVNDQTYQKEVNHKKVQKILAQMYLGRLATEKEFAQRIHEYPELVDSPNKASSRALHDHATKQYKRAIHRQDVLRMRCPLYVTLFRRREIPRGHKRMREKEKQIKRNNIIIEADFMLRSLHSFRMRKDYPSFFRCVDRIKDKFDLYSDSMFPLKQKCLNTLYKMTAWAYIDTRNLMTLESEELKAIYLKHQVGIYVAKLPRDVDLAWVPVINRKDTLKIFRRRFAMASQPLELAWLYHEFCKYLINIRRFDLARFYAKKSRDLGQEAKSEQWMLNANHLMIRIEIDQNNRNEAKEATLMALTSAKRLGINYLIDFYNRLLSIMDELDIERVASSNGIAARQQLIVDLVPEEMKTEVDFLWRRMNVVPARRRMSVMPGCKPVDYVYKLPCKRMTILPSPPKDPEKIQRTKLLQLYASPVVRPGYVDFEKYE